MARSLTPRDARNIMTALYRQATGQSNISIVDTSSFVSAGETVLATGVENTLNALSIVIGRTLAKVRPYSAKFNLINETDASLYATRLRMIKYYSKAPLESGSWNTDINTNLKDGFDNNSNGGAGTAGQYEQHAPKVLEYNFAGQDVWQDCITFYENALKVAFTSETDFNTFIAGILTAKGNDIELVKEAFNRMTFINRIAGEIDIDSIYSDGSVIDLTAGFNAEYGTNYTRAQLLTQYLPEFMKYFVEQLKLVSMRMRNHSTKYHLPMTLVDGSDTYKYLTHSDKENQKLAVYEPFMIKAEANVLPQIFNDDYLKIENYEPVMFWQSEDAGASIKVTPAIPNVQANGSVSGGQIKGADVEEAYVLASL